MITIETSALVDCVRELVDCVRELERLAAIDLAETRRRVASISPETIKALRNWRVDNKQLEEGVALRERMCASLRTPLDRLVPRCGTEPPEGRGT